MEDDEGPIFKEDLNSFAWMHYRVRDACEALCRYAGRPASDEFIELLEELAELNYFIANGGGRLYDWRRLTKARTLLENIIKQAETFDVEIAKTKSSAQLGYKRIRL